MILLQFYKYNDNLHVIGGRNQALSILKTISEFKNLDKIRITLSIETTNLSAYLKFGCVRFRKNY